MSVLALSEFDKPRRLNRVEAAVVNAARDKGVPRLEILDVKCIRGRWKVWILNKGWRELAEI